MLLKVLKNNHLTSVHPPYWIKAKRSKRSPVNYFIPKQSGWSINSSSRSNSKDVYFWTWWFISSNQGESFKQGLAQQWDLLFVDIFSWISSSSSSKVTEGTFVAFFGQTRRTGQEPVDKHTLVCLYGELSLIANILNGIRNLWFICVFILSEWSSVTQESQNVALGGSVSDVMKHQMCNLYLWHPIQTEEEEKPFLNVQKTTVKDHQHFFSRPSFDRMIFQNCMNKRERITTKIYYLTSLY